MKNNELAYKLFAAALLGMLIILALCACTDEPEQQLTGLKFHGTNIYEACTYGVSRAFEL